MSDMRRTIIPKSDQLNADDLITGPMTIKITKVSIAAGEQQPAAISFEGDEGKPYKPCKSMCRVLVLVWGKDGNSYVGKSMTIYRDPEVKWAGEKIGGIRISHMSDIDQRMVMALTATRGSRKAYVVHPLVVGNATEALVAEGAEAAEHGAEFLKEFWERLKKAQQQPLLSNLETWKKRATEVDAINAESA